MVSCFRLRYFNFEPSFKLRWGRARDSFGSQNLDHKLLGFMDALWHSGLGNYFVCRRFAVQTLLWSLEFVIQIKLEHDTIAVYFLSLNIVSSFDWHKKKRCRENLSKLRGTNRNNIWLRKLNSEDTKCPTHLKKWG